LDENHGSRKSDAKGNRQYEKERAHNHSIGRLGLSGSPSIPRDLDAQVGSAECSPPDGSGQLESRHGAGSEAAPLKPGRESYDRLG
jgi:hypothetical protein